MKDIKISFLADYYGALLNEKSLMILRWYYDEDLSLSEIAEKVGITRQGVQDYLKKSVFVLKEYEEKLGFMKRLDELKQELRQSITELSKNPTDTSSITKSLEELISKY